MKKRALFFDCFYSFTFVLSPLSLSRFTILNKKIYKKLSTPASKNEYLRVSASNGQLFSILYFIRYTDDFDWALAYAALGGYIELCKHLIKLGATAFNWALSQAARAGYIALCKYFIKLGANDFNRALAYAANGGQTEVCNYLIKLGATDFNCALANAACGGQTEVCKYLIKLGANNFNRALANAKDEKTKEFLIQYIKKK